MRKSIKRKSQKKSETTRNITPDSVEFELPPNYGDTQVTLLVKDPWWLYAYWELSGSRVQKTVLRIYELTGGTPEAEPLRFFDIQVQETTGNWFIDVGLPDKFWRAEIGFIGDGGRFFVLARSGVVKTPRFGVSEAVDPEWYFSDEIFWKIFRCSGGMGESLSSHEVQRIVVQPELGNRPGRAVLPRRKKAL